MHEAISISPRGPGLAQQVLTGPRLHPERSVGSQSAACLSSVLRTGEVYRTHTLITDIHVIYTHISHLIALHFIVPY